MSLNILTKITSLKEGGLVKCWEVWQRGEGGFGEMLTMGDKGGKGAWEMLTIADKGGGEACTPHFWLTYFVNSPL